MLLFVINFEPTDDFLLGKFLVKSPYRRRRLSRAAEGHKNKSVAQDKQKWQKFTNLSYWKYHLLLSGSRILEGPSCL